MYCGMRALGAIHDRVKNGICALLNTHLASVKLAPTESVHCLQSGRCIRKLDKDVAGRIVGNRDLWHSAVAHDESKLYLG